MRDVFFTMMNRQSHSVGPGLVILFWIGNSENASKRLEKSNHFHGASAQRWLCRWALAWMMCNFRQISSSRAQIKLEHNEFYLLSHQQILFLEIKARIKLQRIVRKASQHRFWAQRDWVSVCKLSRVATEATVKNSFALVVYAMDVTSATLKLWS